jgi:GTPase SAR1 family protein
VLCQPNLGAVSGHLAYARLLIRNHGLEGADASALTDRLDAAERRLADPRVYLAVIGEFSSGKSTFINALLGEDVLAASVMPTTAVAVKILGGDTPSVTAALGDQRFTHVFSEAVTLPPPQLVQLLARHVPDEPAPETLGSLLALVTVHPALSALTSELEVQHPSALLTDGLTIIDTPGTNADIAGHVDITRRIMAQDADLAVVTVSAHAPVAETLVAFLQEALSPAQLERCVFVVTRMDDVDAEERQPLLDVIRRRLLGRLSLPSVVVLAAAPACVLKQVRGEPLTTAEEEWCERFVELRESLRRAVRRERQTAVDLNVLRLTDDALSTLQRQLDARRAELADRQRQLASAPIRHLDAFLGEQQRAQYLAFGSACARERRQLSKTIDDRETLLRAAATASLNAASSRSNLSRVMKSEVPALLETHRKALESELQGVVGRETAAAAVRALRSLSEAFDAGYRQLQRLSPLPLPKHPASQPFATDALEAGARASGATIAAFARPYAAAGEVAGAAAGAFIGTFVIPVPIVGTAVGAVVGGILGGLFGTPLEELRTQHRQQVATVISDFLASVRREVERTGEGHEAQLRQLMRLQAAKYRSKYDPIVRAAIDAQDAEQRRLEGACAHIACDIDELRGRRDAVEELRSGLVMDLEARRR